MLRERIRLILLAISEAWLVLCSLWIWRGTYEDAFIIYRYAQDLANGYGLVFNAGERVEGYTSFLWVLVLGGTSKITSDPLLMSKLLGIAFNALALVACYLLCRASRTRGAPLYGISLALVASNGLFIATSVEGLETPLFTMLLCWGVFTYLKALETGARGQSGWLAGSSVLFALLIMTRPDGALAYGLLWLHAAWKFRSRLRDLAIFTLPLLFLYTPYFFWRWHYYGLFFPNTFYAKRGGTLALYARGAVEISNFLGSQTGGFLVAGLLALSAILFPAMETTAMGLPVLSRLIFEFWSGGLTAGKFRFLIPALPLIWILTERLLVGWLGAARLGSREPVLLVGLSSLLVVAQMVDFVRLRHEEIDPARAGLERAHVALGKWLKEHSPPDSKVAVGDIGAIGFWSGLRVLDLDGLADTHIARLPGGFGDKRDSRYVLAQSPDFIILRVHRCQPELDDITLGMDREIYADPQFQRSFQRLTCWHFRADYHLLLYRRNGEHAHGESDRQRGAGNARFPRP